MTLAASARSLLTIEGSSFGVRGVEFVYHTSLKSSKRETGRGALEGAVRSIFDRDSFILVAKPGFLPVIFFIRSLVTRSWCSAFSTFWLKVCQLNGKKRRGKT